MLLITGIKKTLKKSVALLYLSSAYLGHHVDFMTIMTECLEKCIHFATYLTEEFEQVMQMCFLCNP